MTKSPDAARRAVQVIRAGVKVLGKQPEIGRHTAGMLPAFREFIIDFGSSAYVVLYQFDGELVVLLAIRHGREAGY